MNIIKDIIKRYWIIAILCASTFIIFKYSDDKDIFEWLELVSVWIGLIYTFYKTAKEEELKKGFETLANEKEKFYSDKKMRENARQKVISIFELLIENKNDLEKELMKIPVVEAGKIGDIAKELNLFSVRPYFGGITIYLRNYTDNDINYAIEQVKNGNYDDYL